MLMQPGLPSPAPAGRASTELAVGNRDSRRTNLPSSITISLSDAALPHGDGEEAEEQREGWENLTL
jgi:hypothetical protein